tara:strand:+ start:354 stop:998 length:645 start_codon:yes stop_codon:yes gene_type:complete
MKFDCIVWDWNGTIVNDAWVFVDVMNFFLKMKGLPKTSLDDYKKNFGFPIQNYWKTLGFKFNNKEFNLLNKSFIEEYQKRIFLPKLQPGIVDLIKKINRLKIKQFVLSASENSLLHKSVGFYKINSLFEDVVGVDNLNAVGKISLAKVLFKKNNLHLNKTLVIGDTKYDLDVAQALGCSALLVSYGHIEHKRLLDLKVPLVRSVKEIESFLFAV